MFQPNFTTPSLMIEIAQSFDSFVINFFFLDKIQLSLPESPSDALLLFWSFFDTSFHSFHKFRVSF